IIRGVEKTQLKVLGRRLGNRESIYKSIGCAACSKCDKRHNLLRNGPANRITKELTDPARIKSLGDLREKRNAEKEFAALAIRSIRRSVFYAFVGGGEHTSSAGHGYAGFARRHHYGRQPLPPNAAAKI